MILIWAEVCLCGIFIFDSVLFLLKLIFLFNKKYGLFDFKGASTKNCESVKKGKFVMKSFFQIILNKVLNPQYWHFCKGIKMMICIQWNLSKADTYGTEVFFCFREVSTLERFELKSPKFKVRLFYTRPTLTDSSYPLFDYENVEWWKRSNFLWQCISLSYIKG